MNKYGVVNEGMYDVDFYPTLKSAKDAACESARVDGDGTGYLVFKVVGRASLEKAPVKYEEVK